MEKQEYTFRVEYEIDKNTQQVIVTIPDLDNISSFGSTFVEAETNIIEVAADYIGTLQEEGKPIPQTSPFKEGTYIKLIVPEMKTVE